MSIENSRVDLVIKIIILCIPGINIIASVIWAFSGNSIQTRVIGRTALGVITGLTFLFVWYGISGVQALIHFIERLG